MTGGRPPTQFKRAGLRHWLLMSVHEQTWLDDKAWCARRGIIPSELLAAYKAQTVVTARLLLDTANNAA